MQNNIKQGIHILFMKRIDTYALRPVSWFMGEHKLETFLTHARINNDNCGYSITI